MEPISSRTERTVGENFENPVLDGVFSDGQTLSLFSGMLQEKSEMDFWLSLSRNRVDDLLREAVRQTKPGWSQARLGAEVDRLRDILGQAIFFRLKADMCHRASRDLLATARDLRAIAADPAKIRALRDGLSGFSAGEACLENLVGPRGSASVLELKDALHTQAKHMESLAAGLHVRDLLGRENPLREMPELSRRLFESLPQESFVREIFPEQLNRYLERREFERDALVYWKAVCAIATMFSGNLGAAAGWVGRLARAGNWGMDRRGAGNGFDHATAFSTAAYLSGGARADDFERAQSARDAASTANALSGALSLASLLLGRRMPTGINMALRASLSELHAASTGAGIFDLRCKDGERVDEFIHRLAQSNVASRALPGHDGPVDRR